MIRMNIAVAVALIALIRSPSATAQQDLERQRAALKEIRETAADICYTVEQRGRKSEAQLTGEVQAKVNGVVAKLADIGIKGSGHIDSMEYRGVSQEALATAFTASVNCREGVFKNLVDRMLPSSSSSSSYTPPQPASPAAIPAPLYQPQQRAWQYTSDPRPKAVACDQGGQEAGRALLLHYQAGCQMGKPDDCNLANNMLSKGYR